MGGGNGQKSKMAREKNMEKQKNAARGSQLESNKKAMSIQVFLLLFLALFLKKFGGNSIFKTYNFDIWRVFDLR